MSFDDTFIPYGRQSIDDDDIASVVDVLRSDWLTTGPKTAQFEKDICDYVNVAHGVAVSSGTAALHCAVVVAGVEEGDEVIVTPITFAASANCVLYRNAMPVFADVDYATMLMSPDSVKQKITSKTRAVIAVDYAGQPCDYMALRQICDQHDLVLIADCAHSLGADINGVSPATIADLATFSFHPVKHITTGEGGMVVTNDGARSERMRRFRNHGIDVDHAQRAREGAWMYGMVELGFNYRMTDFQCALGSSQLRKLDGWIARRREIAHMYDEAFSSLSALESLVTRSGVNHAHHLYVLRLSQKFNSGHRQEVFDSLRRQQIGVNVHYIPVYRHPYYQQNVNTSAIRCPNAEAGVDRIISLPMHSALTDAQIGRVIGAVKNALIELERR